MTTKQEWLQKALAGEKDLRGAKLGGVELRMKRMLNVDLSGADLSGSDFAVTNLTSAKMENAVMRGTRFAGSHLYKANMSNAALSSADFESADLRLAKFNGSDLRGAKLLGALFQRTDFSGAQLTGADLTFSDLKEMIVTLAVVDKTTTGINFDEWKARGAIVLLDKEVWLKKARSGTKDLEMANLEGARLVRANLPSANLQKANLKGADLTNANLRNANFTGADLSGAILNGANLRGTIFFDADLTGANWLDGRIDASRVNHSTKGIDFYEWIAFQGIVIDPPPPTPEPGDGLAIYYRIADSRDSSRAISVDVRGGIEISMLGRDHALWQVIFHASNRWNLGFVLMNKVTKQFLISNLADRRIYQAELPANGIIPDEWVWQTYMDSGIGVPNAIRAIMPLLDSELRLGINTHLQGGHPRIDLTDRDDTRWRFTPTFC